MWNWLKPKRCQATTLVLISLAPTVRAQAIDFTGALGDVPATICNLAAFLAGPVGFALVSVVVIIGFIIVLSQRRGGMGFVVTAFVISLMLVAAPQILATFGGDTCAL